MDCFHPCKIQNPDYKIENGYEGYPEIFVPCGRCEACIVNNASEWRSRLEIEWKCSETAYFITLTYDDDTLPLGCFPNSFGETFVVPYVSKRDCQLFLKRLRKRFPSSSIRYFLVSEYGPTTLRPHYHALVFGLPRFSSDETFQSVKITKAIQDVWNHGHIVVDSVNIGRIAYVTKYLSCVTDIPEYYPKPFRLMSRRPGIGSSYMDFSDRVNWHRNTLSNFYPDGNFKKRLPRYLKDKIFDDNMKCQIKENLDEFRKSRLIEDSKNAARFGYSNPLEYRKDMIDKFIRKFDKKLKKSRKDV